MFHWLKIFISKLIIENPTTIGVLYNKFCKAGNITGFNPTDIAPYLGFFVYIMGLAKSGGNDAHDVFPKMIEHKDVDEYILAQPLWFIQGYPNDRKSADYEQKEYKYLSPIDIGKLRDHFPSPAFDMLFKFGPGWYWTDGQKMEDVSVEDAFSRFGKHIASKGDSMM